MQAGKEAGLSVLALGGGLCLLAVLAGALFDISLVVFRTGSMSPGINPGDLAVVREVTASTLQQGDVATVQREGSALPVTHRIVASHADPSDPQKVFLTMKGDANSSADPVRYNVQTAKKLLFPVPGIGYWVMHLQKPWLLAICTLVITALVTWTFWPKASAVQHSPLQAGTR